MRTLFLMGLVSFLTSCSSDEIEKSDSEKDQKGKDVHEDVTKDIDYEEADAFNFGPGIGS
jgi:hypothetical protein